MTVCVQLSVQFRFESQKNQNSNWIQKTESRRHEKTVRNNWKEEAEYKEYMKMDAVASNQEQLMKIHVEWKEKQFSTFFRRINIHMHAIHMSQVPTFEPYFTSFTPLFFLSIATQLLKCNPIRQF